MQWGRGCYLLLRLQLAWIFCRGGGGKVQFYSKNISLDIIGKRRDGGR